MCYPGIKTDDTNTIYILCKSSNDCVEIWSCHGGWLLRVERGISPKYFVAGSDFIVHTEKTIHNLIPRNNVNLDNTLVTKFLIS